MLLAQRAQFNYAPASLREGGYSASCWDMALIYAMRLTAGDQSLLRAAVDAHALACRRPLPAVTAPRQDGNHAYPVASQA